MSTGRRRFWLVYTVVVLLVILGTGVFTMLDGSASGLVGGAALILLGGYLAVRTVRGMRGATATVQISDLRLTDDGVTVLSGAADNPGRAVVRWPDCVALVASPAPATGMPGTPTYYLQFLVSSDAAVSVSGVSKSTLRARAAYLDLPVSPSLALVWFSGHDQLPRLLEVLDAVRASYPSVRVVDSIRRGLTGDRATSSE